MTMTALWNQEEGQDIIEYTLLVSFVTFAAAALFVFGAGGHLRSIWSAGNTQLAAANASAS
jgi:Flp pilus assembly pilin Flp